MLPKGYSFGPEVTRGRKIGLSVLIGTVLLLSPFVISAVAMTVVLDVLLPRREKGKRDVASTH